MNWPPLLSQVTYVTPGGLLSDDDTVNPDFATWSFAWVMYCDGTSYTGNNSEPVVFNGTIMYFRGRLILDAIFSDLVEVCGPLAL